MTQLIQEKNQAVLSSLWELTFRTVLALLLPVALSAQTLDVTCLAKHNGDPVVADSMRIQIPILGIDVVTTSSTIDVGRIASVGQAGNESPMTVSMADIRGRYLGTAVRPAGAPRKWLDREHGVVIGMPMDAMPFHAPQEAQLQATMDVTVTVWRAFWKTSTFAATIPATEGVHMLRTTLELEPWWKRLHVVSISVTTTVKDSSISRENSYVKITVDTIRNYSGSIYIKDAQDTEFPSSANSSEITLRYPPYDVQYGRRQFLCIDTLKNLIVAAYSDTPGFTSGPYSGTNDSQGCSVAELNLAIGQDVMDTLSIAYVDTEAMVLSPSNYYHSERRGSIGRNSFSDEQYVTTIRPYTPPVKVAVNITFRH
jgi:hypothetical protein